MNKRNVLGRGLGALIPRTEKKESNLVRCQIEEIQPNRLQPRRVFDEEKLKELAASIREKGVIEPLLVRKVDDGYELIAGERRWRAARHAGLKDVPAVILEASDGESLEFAIIENIQREDLNAIEEADGYRHLMEKFSLSQEEVAKKVGKERATVANYLRLLRLPYEIREEIINGTISMGHAKALLSIENQAQQIEICKKIINKGLSVRETERLVKKYKDGPRDSALRTSHVRPVEDELKGLFGTKVAVKERNGRGRIEIEFYSEEELERLLEILRSISAPG